MRALAVLVVVVAALAGTAVSARGGSQDSLVAALALDGLPYSAGVVRDGRVVLAAGLEADVARALGRSLRARVSFVHVPRARLARPGPWDVALGVRTAGDAPSFLRGDHVVVVPRGATAPRSRAELASRALCAQRGSRAADALFALHPAGRLLARNSAELERLLRTGACDAALADATSARALPGRPAGRIESALAYGVRAEPRVQAALRRLAADGTLARLRRSWLGIDPARLRRLR